jgi:hypothetical protein
MLVTNEARCTLDPARPRLWLPCCSRFMTAFTAPVAPWNAESAIAAACAFGMLLVGDMFDNEFANKHDCSCYAYVKQQCALHSVKCHDTRFFACFSVISWSTLRSAADTIARVHSPCSVIATDLVSPNHLDSATKRMPQPWQLRLAASSLELALPRDSCGWHASPYTNVQGEAASSMQRCCVTWKAYSS